MVLEYIPASLEIKLMQLKTPPPKKSLDSVPYVGYCIFPKLGLVRVSRLVIVVVVILSCIVVESCLGRPMKDYIAWVFTRVLSGNSLCVVVVDGGGGGWWWVVVVG